MSSRARWLAFFFLILGGAGVFWLIRKPKDIYHNLLSADRQSLELSLKSGRAESAYLTGSVIRLANRQDRLAREVALKWADSSRRELREGAAFALAAFADAACDQKLEQLSRDPESSVRLAAFQAIPAGTPNYRRGWLESKNVRDLSGMEAIAFHRAVAFSTREPKLAKRSVAALLSIARRASRLEEQIQAVSAVKGVAPTDSGLFDLYRAWLRSPAVRPELRELGVQPLSVARDSWLRLHWRELLLQDADENLRRSLLMTVQWSCPDDRWRGIEAIFQSSLDSETKRVAVRAVQSLGGPRAQEFLNRLLDSGQFTTEAEITALQAALKPFYRPGAGVLKQDSCESVTSR